MAWNFPIAMIAVVLLVSMTAPARADDFERHKERCLETRFAPTERIESCTWLLNSGQISSDSGRSLALQARGTLYRSVGDLRHSLADLSEALGQNRGNIDAYAARAATYMLLRDFDRCVADFNSFFRTQPGHYYHWLRRGQCWLGLKKLDEARDDILKADEVCEKSGRKDCELPVALVMGDMVLAHSDFQSADELYRALLEDEPGNKTVLNAVAWFRASAAEGRYRNGKEALRLARKSVELEKTPSSYDSQAAAYAEIGQFDDAIRSEAEAIRLLRLQIPDSGAIRGYEKRLDAYRKQQPLRCPSDLCD